MKILQVIHAFPPEIGGMENHVYYLSRSLSSLNCKVTVFTSKTKGVLDREIIDGINIRRFLAFKLPYFSSIRFSPTLFFNILIEDFDIIHAHGYGSLHPFFAALAAKIKKKPFIFTLHGIQKFQGLKEKILFNIYTFLFGNFILDTADKIISVSSDVKQAFKNNKKIQKKIEVVWNGVDKNFFEGSNISTITRSKSNNLLYVGRLDNQQKNVSDIVDLFYLISKKYQNLNLIFVGKDEGCKENLIRKASYLGISNKITFKEVNFKEIPKIYKLGKLVILPSRYEGLSLVLLESIACGCPIVTTSVGDNPKVMKYIFKKYAKDFLAKPGDLTDLELKVDNILAKYKFYKSLVLKRKKFLYTSFSWLSVARKTLKIYKKVMK